VRFNQGMAIAEDWPWLLLDALDATAQQSDQLHLDLCQVYDDDPCSCGVPETIVEVRDRVFAQAGERLAERASQAQRAA
jgi:hypothetical protein